MGKRLVVALLLSAMAGAIACGGDSEPAEGVDPTRGCEASCDLRDECGFLSGLTLAECVTECVADSDDSCPITQAQADACISAIEAATCGALISGGLPDCEFCPQSNAGAGGT